MSEFLYTVPGIPAANFVDAMSCDQCKDAKQRFVYSMDCHNYVRKQMGNTNMGTYDDQVFDICENKIIDKARSKECSCEIQ